MNLSRSFWRRLLTGLALTLVATAPFAGAQTRLGAQLPLPSTTPPPRQGLIGASYALFDLSAVNERHGSGRTFGPSVGLNLALTDNADFTTTFTQARQRNWPDNGNLYQIGGDWNFHLNYGPLKPFIVAGIGYQFSRATSSDDFGLWDAGAGIEWVVAPQTALTLKAVNAGAFRKNIANAWQYTLGASYWLNHRLAVTGGITLVESQALGYSLGVRWGF